MDLRREHHGIAVIGFTFDADGVAFKPADQHQRAGTGFIFDTADGDPGLAPHHIDQLIAIVKMPSLGLRILRIADGDHTFHASSLSMVTVTVSDFSFSARKIRY